jgi:hypothetical protein
MNLRLRKRLAMILPLPGEKAGARANFLSGGLSVLPPLADALPTIPLYPSCRNSFHLPIPYQSLGKNPSCNAFFT